MTLPSTPSFRLDGRRALVAGASSGIGAACAVALGEAGAEVTLAARSADKLNALAAEMAAAGMSVKTLCVDVSDVEATEAAVAANGPLTCWSTPQAPHDTAPQPKQATQILTLYQTSISKVLTF